jgi:predicted transcriptional regulator
MRYIALNNMDSKLQNGTNVRMDIETRRRVERLARRLRVKKSDLIRNAIYDVLPKWERHGVKLAALNFDESKTEAVK